MIGVNVVAIRVHAAHRKKYCSTSEPSRGFSRLSTMFDENQDAHIADHPPSEERNKVKSPCKWTVQTVYSDNKVLPTSEKAEIYYLDPRRVKTCLVESSRT